MRCRMHESSTRNESASLSKNISSSVSSVLQSLENLRLKNCELAVSVEMVVWKTSPPTLRKTLSLVPSDRARFLWDDMARREIRGPARSPPQRAQLLSREEDGPLRVIIDLKKTQREIRGPLPAWTGSPPGRAHAVFTSRAT